MSQQRSTLRHRSRLPLEELPERLQARVDATHGARERLLGLLDSVLSVGSELDLPHALRRLVEAATVLVDAEYGALGVVGDGELAQCVPVGVTQERIEAIGPLPTGHGLLGELLRRPEPLRLAEITRHPAPRGASAPHPPTQSFLGVPLRMRREVLGTLYVAEKRGGGDFDEEDEAVLSTLAVAAGIALDNARLYERSRSRQRWLSANADITASLLSGREEAAVLDLIVRHARRILQADLGVLALAEEGGRTLRVALVSGEEADRHQGLLLPRDGSFLGAAAAAGRPITSSNISRDARITAGPPRWRAFGPAVAVPMVAENGATGVLFLARKDPLAVFTELETAPLFAYAGQAALAMELADRRRDAEQLALLEDRDRIARDLHDLAVQRLFATGLSVQSALRYVDHPEVRERLLRTIDDLDETTRIIRSTIFGLRRKEGRDGTGLRARVARAVEDAAPALRFRPALHLAGLIDTAVPPRVADELEAVLEEALANVVRHAEATTAEVSLTVADEAVTLSVRDDGVGIREHGRRSGLRNLAERAEKLGGRFTVSARRRGGTCLTWSAPLGAGPGSEDAV